MAVSATHGSEGPFIFGRRIENWTSDRIDRGSGLALVCDRAVVGSKNETETCSGNVGFGGENEYHKSFNENRDEEVIIARAGAFGLAVAACLTDLGISSLVLHRDFCMGRCGKTERTIGGRCRAAINTPTFLSCLFLMNILCSLPGTILLPTWKSMLEDLIFSRSFASPWSLQASLKTREDGMSLQKCSSDNSEREYHGRFLVVAAGEFNENFVPDVPGPDSFQGTVIHSIDYKNEKGFEVKSVLVMGWGNYGMEIALELVNNDAGSRSSIVVRSPDIHYQGKELREAAAPIGYH